MPEAHWNMDPNLEQEQWDLYEAKKPLLKKFEKRLQAQVPVAKVCWDPSALDVFFWAGGVGTSVTLDIWGGFTPEDAEGFQNTCTRVYKAVLGKTA